MLHMTPRANSKGDGDQDLIVLTGAGGGLGSVPNYLFVNEDGFSVNIFLNPPQEFLSLPSALNLNL